MRSSILRSGVALGARRARALATLFGVIASGACAQQESNTISACNTKSSACIGSAGSGSGGTSNGAGASGMPSSSAGMTAAGTTATAGTDAGGTAGAPAAGAPSSGAAGAATGGTAGAATAGAAGGGASGAGTGGNAGKAGAGGSAGGGGGASGSAGTGGNAGAAGSGGSAGAGGGQGALCLTPVPARTAWTATSNVAQSAGDLPPNAVDTDLGSRYATGTKMLGGEYLQIDLGSASTVDQVTVLTSNADYGRHLKIKMSNTSADTAAATLAEADGLMGLQTFSFTPTTARYILIEQTGTLASGITWWSVYDVNAYCK